MTVMTLGQCIRDALHYAAARTQMTDTQRVDLLIRILTSYLKRHKND